MRKGVNKMRHGTCLNSGLLSQIRTFVYGEAKKVSHSLWLKNQSCDVGSASQYASKGSENTLSNYDPVPQNYLYRSRTHNSF